MTTLTDPNVETAMPGFAEADASNETSSLVLAFLSCPQGPAKSFLGAVLVTDATGHPLEFSYVDPIRPTRMQRILYGRLLEEHVKKDLIARKLLEGLAHKPDITFVDTDELLALQRKVANPSCT